MSYYPPAPTLAHPHADDLRWLDLARHAALYSEDPSARTGAVLVRRGHVVGVGWNRLPRSVPRARRLEILADRELKYASICHCERVAHAAAGLSASGATLFTWPFMSCGACASHMAEAGIVRHVAPWLDPAQNPRRRGPMELACEIYEHAGVQLCLTPELPEGIVWEEGRPHLAGEASMVDLGADRI